MQIHSEPHSTSYFKKGLWWKIVLSIAIVLGLGFLSGYFSAPVEQDWYENLNKPVFQPPRWLFGPVWTVMYILIGASFGIIWQVSHKARYPIIKKFANRGLIIFIIHFVLNLLWTPLFFSLHAPGVALVDIVILLVLVIILIRHFFRLDRIAAFLLIPYLIWILFATVLNASILAIN
ncbi:MAG: TspO/MBR family protein [Brumimicrobium sp.]|nr:TspO/MBR family protein [Brumimicrobium sp.]